MRTSSLLSWSLLFLCSCNFQASCGNNDGLLNTKKGEKVIAEWLEKQDMAPELVVCPHDIKMDKSSSFVCKATIANAAGLIIDIKVDQKNDDGDIHLSHGSPVMASERIERGLAGQILDQTGEKVKAECGVRARSAVPQTKFECSAKGEKTDYGFEITILDEVGGWQAKRL